MKKLTSALLKKLPTFVKILVWRLLTVPRVRARVKAVYLLSAREMDTDLLCEEIRRLAHSLRFLGAGGSREYAAGKLREYLDEFRSRRGSGDIPDDMREAVRILDGNFESVRAAENDLSAPGYDEVFSAIRLRRSVRRFAPEPVPRDLVERIIDAGRWAPSSCNRQTWKIAAFCRSVPAVLYVAIDERPYPEKYAAALDAGAIVQNMLLAASSLGLGACWIYQGDSVDQRSLRKKTGLPPHYYVYSAVLVGRPSENPPHPARKPLDGNVSFFSAPPPRRRIGGDK